MKLSRVSCRSAFFGLALSFGTQACGVALRDFGSLTSVDVLFKTFASGDVRASFRGRLRTSSLAGGGRREPLGERDEEFLLFVVCRIGGEEECCARAAAGAGLGGGGSSNRSSPGGKGTGPFD